MFEYLIYHAAGFEVNLLRLEAARHFNLQNTLQDENIIIYKRSK